MDMKFNEEQKHAIYGDDKKILCLAAAASGKALPNSTLIPTPSGYKKVGDIKIGDFLFSHTGRPTKVLGVYPQGKKTIYEIYFADGRMAECSGDHIWSVRCDNWSHQQWNNRTTKELQIMDGTFYIPMCKSVEYETKDFTIDPYKVGSILSVQRYAPIFSEQEIINLSKQYLLGDKKQRISFLNGFLDDGIVIKEDNAFCIKKEFTNDEQVQLVSEMLDSLGYYNTFSKRYLYVFIDNQNKDVFDCVYRSELYEEIEQSAPVPREEVEITCINETDKTTDMTCFYVDNAEHLFLTENYIVTHNTAVLTERIRHLVEDLKVPPNEIVAITFTNAAAAEMRKRLGSMVNKAFIGTVHSYANNICRMNGIDNFSSINEEDFEKILEKAIDIPEEKYPKVSHLLVDECQDLDEKAYFFLYKIPAENIFFCGDERQMIYAFRGSCDDYIRLMWESPDYENYYLNQNYRNAPNIISFADSFLSTMKPLSPKTKAVKRKKGDIHEVSFFDALADLEDVTDYSQWFIITRTNKQLDNVVKELADRQIPCTTFKKADLDLEELGERLKSNQVKVLTMHCAKGLEAQNVIAVGAKIFNDEERRIAYVAATRAKSKLYWCPDFKPRAKGDANRVSVASSGARKVTFV